MAAYDGTSLAIGVQKSAAGVRRSGRGEFRHVAADSFGEEFRFARFNASPEDSRCRRREYVGRHHFSSQVLERRHNAVYRGFRKREDGKFSGWADAVDLLGAGGRQAGGHSRDFGSESLADRQLERRCLREAAVRVATLTVPIDPLIHIADALDDYGAAKDRLEEAGLHGIGVLHLVDENEGKPVAKPGHRSWIAMGVLGGERVHVVEAQDAIPGQPRLQSPSSKRSSRSPARVIPSAGLRHPHQPAPPRPPRHNSNIGISGLIPSSG